MSPAADAIAKKGSPKGKSSRMFDAYRAFHEQAFVPIFTHCDYDSKKLVEACVAAGYKGIEYTQRRKDSDTMIPWVRKNFPDLYLLVGSTLDDDTILAHARKNNPNLRTLAELADMDIDGFVSMIGWKLENIRKYAPTHILAPTASTVTEAFQQVGAGAHFIKLMGPDLGIVKVCRGEATFGFCPILVTGGQLPERIPDTIAAGAMTVGAGVELVLKGESRDVSVPRMAELLKKYLDAAQAARAKFWPKTVGGSRAEWLNALPHWHPFGAA